MSDPLSLTANVAGVIGITGQVLQGCIFIKDFIGDVQSAPKDIKNLQIEVENLMLAARAFGGVVKDGAEAGCHIPEEVCTPALEQCFNAVNGLKGAIQLDVERFADGKSRLWDRLRSAGRRSSLEKHLNRLGRATNSLQVAQSNVTNLWVQDNHLSLRAARNNSTLAQNALSTLVGSGFEETNQQLQLNECLLRDTMNQFTLTHNELSTSIETRFKETNQQLRGVSSSLNELTSKTPQMFLGHDMIMSIVRTALREHQEEIEDQSKLRSSSQNLVDSSGEKTYESQLLFPKMKSKESANPTDLPWISQSGPTTEMQRRRTTYKSTYRTRFFDVEVKTSKFVESYKAEGNSRPTDHPFRTSTTYRIRSKIPFLRKGIYLEKGGTGAYSSAFDMQLRVHNIVSHDSPAIQACEKADLPELRRLFKLGLASPFDETSHGNSLLEILLRCFLLFRADENGVLDVFRFLIDCGAFRGRVVGPVILYFFLEWLANPPPGEVAFAELVRLILKHSNEDPLEGVAAPTFLPLENDTPDLVQEVLINQEHWAIDWEHLEDPYHEKICPEALWENDRMLIADPNGERLQECVSRGHIYCYRVAHSPREFAECPVFTLLYLLAVSRREDLRHVCLGRIALLILAGWSPRCLGRLSWMEYTRSPTRHAIELEVTYLWVEALKRAKWTDSQIQELFDEELYDGIAPLISGAISYLSRDECRVGFLRELCSGSFILHKKHTGILIIGVIVSWNISVPVYEVQSTINQTSLALEQCQLSMPGGWQQEDEARRRLLIPGVDFELPQLDLDGKVIDWEPYIRLVDLAEGEEPHYQLYLPEYEDYFIAWLP